MKPNNPDILPYNCELRPNPRNRRLKLSYRSGRGFLVTYPPRTSARIVRQFVESNRMWMERVACRINPNSQAQTIRDYLGGHPSLILDGKEYKIEFRNAGGLLRIEGEQISIFTEISENQLLRKLQILAEKPLKFLLKRIAATHKLTVSSIQIRNQKSRWGSCSARKGISLNWRLILMPPTLQEHIILHELAHLIHPDHSPQFWSLLEKWDPDFHMNKALLRKEGSIWIHLGHENPSPETF